MHVQSQKCAPAGDRERKRRRTRVGSATNRTIRRHDEASRESAHLNARMTSSEPRITPEKVGSLAVVLRDKLYDGPPKLRRAYARLLMNNDAVSDQAIRISGSKAVLARSASDGLDQTTPAVLSFVQDWRTREDSNLWPLPSENLACPTMKFDRFRSNALCY